MRKLIVVPTIHDTGETHPIYAAQAKLLPQHHALEEVKNVMWQSIDQAMMQHSSDIPHWKVFAEGVFSFIIKPPQLYLYTEAKQQAVESMPDQPRQHMLLTSLWLAGATFIPTDDPQAYQKTFDAWAAYQQLGEQMESLELDEPLDAQTQKKAEALMERISTLRREQDEHVGDIINSNLQDEETGVLIFGALHNTIHFLPKDVAVSFISEETNKFWKLLQDPQMESLYDAATYFLEGQRKGKEPW